MNDNILKLLQDRYFLKDEKTWGDLVERVSVLYPEIKPYMLDMEFIPSTPTLQNANTKGERQGTLSSCFILKVKDSIEDIYDAIKEGAVVTKNGGGCGWNFSYLRSSKENINSLNANSSGPIAFIGGFNQMLDDIRQGGKRRGAGLGSLSIHHGDILEFINIKNDLTKLNRMNLSSRMTNKFYKQLNEDSNSIHQVFDRNGTYFDLEDKEGKKVTVKQIWDLIVEQAWKVAEPGLFNEDIAFDRCTVTNLDTEVSGNPCVEFTGIPYQSCNLGSINLSKLIKGTVFDWEKFEQLVKHGVRFLNQVIDHNKFPLKKIKEITLKTRPIGLGVMGLAHILYKLKIPYNSKLALDFAYSLFNKMTLIGMQESVELSKKIMGAGAYSAFDYDLFMKANERFFKYDDLEEIKKLKKDIKKYGIRNSAITSIAPTGSISFLAETSGGMEPVFALVYSRKIEKLNKEYEVVYIVDPAFKEYLEEKFDENTMNRILKEIANNKGSCQKCKDIPDIDKKVFVVAGDLTPMEHLDMLEVVSRNVSLSVSKTINLKSDATKEEVSQVYLEAHKRGIIGVTVYRDGCRENILSTSSANEDKNSIVYRDSPKRPKQLPCDVYRITIKGEKYIAFIGLLEGKPYEVFCGKIDEINLSKHIKSGAVIKEASKQYSFSYEGEVLIKNVVKTFDNSEHEAFARMISTSLRHGTKLAFVIDQLSKSKGSIVDFSKAIIIALKKYLDEGEHAGKCPTCNSKLIYVEGCKSCSSCGYNACGG